MIAPVKVILMPLVVKLFKRVPEMHFAIQDLPCLKAKGALDGLAPWLSPTAEAGGP